MGEIKAHAAEWKANVRAEFRETRRRLSVEIHDKLQRAATIRSMEQRRRLGLDQRAHSLDMLSPEKRAVLASLGAGGGRFRGATSQESIGMDSTKLNNLRGLQAARAAYEAASIAASGEEEGNGRPPQASSEENLFNRFGSLTKLAKQRNRVRDRERERDRDLRRNIPEEVRRACEYLGGSNTTLGENEVDERDEEEEEEEEQEQEQEEQDEMMMEEEEEVTREQEKLDKEENTTLNDLSQYLPDKPKVVQNGFVPCQAKEREMDKMLEGREHQP